MVLRRLLNKEEITLGNSLGGGGEGKIYEVEGESSLVAKIYHTDKVTQVHGDKLRVMLANPPQNTAVAWPIDLLVPVNDNSQVVGFLMPRVRDSRPIHQFYTPKQRREHSPFFNYLFLHRTAKNLATAVKALHSAGYIIGDVNESNILVTPTTLVTLVDTDSFQVRNPENGRVYRCPVGKPECTPPELQGQNFREVNRRKEQDLFGLSVLIFQLLMEGTHPFDGVFKGRGEPPGKRERIMRGHFTYGRKRVPYGPKPTSPPFQVLHPELQELFRRCFEEGHENPKARPNAGVWVRTLAEVERALRTCSVNQNHRYEEHLHRCPWCKRTKLLGGADPFPSQEAVEKGEHLPPKPQKKPTPTPNPLKTIPWGNVLVVGAFLLVVSLGGYFVFRLATYSVQPVQRVSEHTESLVRSVNIGAKLEDTVAISPNGKILARGKDRGRIEIWDLDRGKKIKTLNGQGRLIEAIAISKDGGILVSGDQDGNLAIWDLDNGNLKQGIKGHKTLVKSLVVAPDGKTFVSGGGDGTLKVWDLETSREKRTLEGHKYSVLSLAMSGSGKTLVSGGSDYKIKIWDLVTGLVKHSYNTTNYSVNAVDISTNGNFVISGGGNGTIALWYLNQEEPQFQFQKQQNSVNTIAISPDNQKLVSGREDGTIRIWDLKTKMVHTFRKNNRPIGLVTITSDNKMIISRSGSNQIMMWQMP